LVEIISVHVLDIDHLNNHTTKSFILECTRIWSFQIYETMFHFTTHVRNFL